jgi:N-acetyl-gamma-glutamyl-phosphate reductase
VREHPVIRVSVVGATGYSGAEICALLDRHPHATVASAFSSGRKDSAVPYEGLHPALAGRKGPDAEPFSFERLLASRPDAALLATPNETSAELVPKLLEAGVKAVDLSGAYRLRDAADYPKWYGFTHPAPGLLAEAVYGLTEWCGGELTGARLVANPGCYPTSVLLALKPVLPLLRAGAPVISDSKSGVSGAGKKSDVAYSFAELSGNFKAYSVGTHRHEPEMRLLLGYGAEAPFVFVPHLLPAVRGILSTIHVTFADGVGADRVLEAYRSRYAGAPFVRVRPAGDLPELKDVVGTPRAEIGFAFLPGSPRGVIVSVIDNLLKGAASQAVQNLNRVFGLGETEGLQ